MYNSTNECDKQNELPFQFSYNNYSGVNFFRSIFDNCLINGIVLDEFIVLKPLSKVQTSDIGSFLVQVCY